MDMKSLSMRERLEAVHGDLLAIFADEAMESLLGDLDPKEPLLKGESGPRWPNSERKKNNLLLAF